MGGKGHRKKTTKNHPMTMKSKGKYPKTVFGHMQSFTKMNKFNLKGKNKNHLTTL